MSKKRFTILILIVLLVIGFASITGMLYIKKINDIEKENSVFDVYFSKATITSPGTISGISSRTLTFKTHSLSGIGDTSLVTYEIYNASTEYDINIKMNCRLSSNSNYVSIKSLFDNVDVSAYSGILLSQERKSGYIEITQINENLTESEIELEYICNIVATVI